MGSMGDHVRHVYDELMEFVSYKNNKIYLIIVSAFLIGYQSLQFFLEHPDWYVTFDPGLTIWLQETFSFPLLDYALSYYYPTGAIKYVKADKTAVDRKRSFARSIAQHYRV